MTASESDRILAPGVLLKLATGREVTLRFSLRSLKILEDRFGSVASMTTELNGIIPRNGIAPSNGKIIGTVVPVLAAGLAGEGITEDELLDGPLLEWSELRGAYFDAIAEALDQAFPPPTPSPGKDAEVATASNGVASTTQPPSSVAAMASSGA
jgi:hypothetical protein